MFKKMLTLVLFIVLFSISYQKAYGNTYDKILITDFIKDDSISGIVKNISPNEYKNYKVIVYVKTNKLYIHPFEDGGERLTFSFIDSSGNWWVNSKNRFPEPLKICAFLVSSSFKAPKTAKSIKEIDFIDYYHVDYNEDAVRKKWSSDKDICFQFKDQGQGDELRCMGIYLTDGDDKKILLVKEWLQNPWSGYPDLSNKLKELLGDCASFIQSKSLSGVPLDNIEGWYRNIKFNNRSTLEIKHDYDLLMKGYIKAWEEKNSGFSREEIDLFAEIIIKRCD